MRFLVECAIGFCVLIGVGYGVFALCELNHLLSRLLIEGHKLMADLAALQAAVADNTAAVQELTAAAGNIPPAHDFQPEVDALTANSAAVRAVATQLSAPPTP